jgi:hypothetical protein
METEKDKHVTNVCFVAFDCGDGTEEITALFLDEIADSNGNILSYAHIGQHSAANPELIFNERFATYEEYKDLFNELSAIGYNLYVLSGSDFKPYIEKFNFDFDLPF